MTDTHTKFPIPFAGSRLKTCCGRLGVCACRRSHDIASIPTNFSSNFSSSGPFRNLFSFRKCGNPRCKIKCLENPLIHPSNNCRSSVSGKSFDIITDENLDCSTVNIVYLITCRICNLQYVGETSRAANVRWSEHLYKIRKGETNQLIYKHFNCDDQHRSVPVHNRFTFQIIEKIKTDNLHSQNPALIRKRRTERELFWISQLRTIYPLGLNDKVSGFGIHGNASDKQFTDFNMYRIANLGCDRKSRYRKGRHLKKQRGRITDEQIENLRDELLDLLHENRLNDIEARILSSKRKLLERFVTSTWFSTLDERVRYLIKSRVDFSRKMKPCKKERERISWNTRFTHQIFGDINLNSILNSRRVKSLLPDQLRRNTDIQIIFSFGKTIGKKVLNYNQILKNTGQMSYEDICNMQCSCEHSPFKNDRFGHVITGDLNIIRDQDLRDVCAFGTKFRENPILNPFKICNEMMLEIDKFANKIANKFRLPRNAFKKWKTHFYNNFKSKLYSCNKTNTYRKPILSNSSCKLELDRLRDNFVITVVDKAAGNFAFTCKKFYFLRLAEELGLNNLTPGNDTYGYTPITEEQIVSKIKSDISQFKITSDSNDEKLAILYQTPKFHKNPPKMRYIAGNINTITSKLDKTVSDILKMCKEHFKNLCNKAFNFSGVRYFFDVQTSTEVKAMFDSTHGSAASISINDFSTLYTLFDHDHLLSNMNWLLSKLARNSGMSYVRVGHGTAWWVVNDSEGLVFGVAEVIDMIEYLISNSYIKAFGHIFKQDKGVIMGGKSSGWLSDCSLMVDEYKYIDSKIKSGETEEANKLKFFRRYRDDCTSINIDNFMNISRHIYPPSLELTQENTDFLKANVLDMEVQLENGIICTKVYCKTDAFPFNVISLPFLETNIDKRICYKVFYGQIIRFQRLCSYISGFEERTKHLIDVLISRNYKFNKLQREFCRAIERYITQFQMWPIPLDFKNWFLQISAGNFTITE